MLISKCIGKDGKNILLILCIGILQDFNMCADSCRTLEEANLVEVQKVNPAIVVDLIWATGDNELGLVLYPDGAKCYLHNQAAYALDAVQKELSTYGYGLKVLEAFRPLWAQKIVWQKIGFTPPYPEYGRHTLGTAVDVTLVYVKYGSPVVLPARKINTQNAEVLTFEQKNNLEILTQAMVRNGFIQHDKEWFHFDFNGWQNFKSLNYQFSDLPIH